MLDYMNKLQIAYNQHANLCLFVFLGGGAILFIFLFILFYFTNCCMNLSAGPHMHLICLPADGTLDFMVIIKEGESPITGSRERDAVLLLIFHIFGV